MSSPYRPRILHLSADFPDPLNPHKTPVIARLIDLVAEDYEHEVLSINRRGPGVIRSIGLAAGRVDPVVPSSLQVIPRGIGLAYWAPANGLLHQTMLGNLGRWIAARVVREGRRPDLVIGHKLTVEGLVAHEVSRLLGVPFALTIQGNTDQKILSFRPDLGPIFKQIYRDAACVFSFAPWARHAVERRLGPRKAPTLDLPCPTTFNTVIAPTPHGKALISVFHLRNHRVKNLDGLAQAMVSLAAGGCAVPLQVVGGGSAADIARCEALIAGCNTVSLVGPRTEAELGPMMNEAIALVVPSRRESFGLVFIEALFSGLPIIYPRGAAVDGYFDGLPFAIAVDPGKPQEIAAAIRRMVEEEAAMKAALAQWQASGGLEPFGRRAIGATYARGLAMAIAAGRPAAAGHGDAVS